MRERACLKKLQKLSFTTPVANRKNKKKIQMGEEDEAMEQWAHRHIGSEKKMGYGLSIK